MGFKDSLANSAAPVFIRMALGVTFLWAGLGKCFESDRLAPQDAAILANVGVITTEQAVRPAVPAAQDTHSTSGGLTLALALVQVQPNTQPPGVGKAAPQELLTPGGLAPPSQAPPPTLQVSPARQYTAADFPEGATVLRLHMVTLKLVKAANPPAGAPALWPKFLDRSPWPVALAYAAALTEVLCGFLALTGLLGRFAGFLLAMVMGCAIWLDQIGPAIQSGQTSLGFLPNHAGFDVAAWRPLLWQFTLLMSALSLMCTGSGGLSLDRMLGTGGGGGGGKPPSKPKPKDEI
jgi:uncharacterized membrane protein YphA (DoxX/SURF4 family)